MLVRARFAALVLPSLGPNQSPVKWVPGPFTQVVERSRSGVDYPPPSSAEAKERVDLALCAFMTSDSKVSYHQNKLLTLYRGADKSSARPD